MRAELTERRAAADLRTAARGWTERRSLRLRLVDGAREGWGEAAPLPGYSAETIEEARAALEAFAWPEPVSVEAIAGAADALSAPSARFAAETALLDLLAQRRGVPLWRLLGDARASLPIAVALWQPTPEARRDAARARPAAAYKLKVGGAPIAEERRELTALRAVIGDAELRLDANRAVPPDALEARLAAWAEVAPAFVEEPSTMDAVEALARSAVPLAADESLVDAPARALALPTIQALVLKPARLGLLGALALARAAGPRRVVISHLLDGPIARAACAHLALVASGDAAGLGEHPALAALGHERPPWIGSTLIRRPEAVGLGLEAG